MPLDEAPPNIRRAVTEAVPVQIADVRLEPGYTRATDAMDMGLVSILSVPLLHEGRVIGTIGVARREPGLFPDAAVALLQTFARQAVIAIQNVRLFNETQEALAQQKASAEVLTVISHSVSDTQPVFDKILDSCKHLFGGDELDVLLVDEQGQLQIAAYVGKAFDVVSKTFPAPVDITPAGRAIRERRVVHYPDVLHGVEVPNVMRRMGQLVGYQSLAFAPMLWNDKGVGAIGVARSRGAFSDKELALLQTFADQAVIAIQNVRLFNETQAALQRQTATADMLRIISSSPTDVQPVFDAIVGTALSLIDCDAAVVLRRLGDHYSAASFMRRDEVHAPSTGVEIPVDPQANFPSRVMLDKATLHLPDWSRIELPPHERRIYESGGIAASLMVPLLLRGECIGALGFTRKRPGPFRADEIALAESFRDQAVIAIQNARLFNES
jgi:GAF domain-containing protein